LGRHFGEPRRTGNPWRLVNLDLSGNGLSDECAKTLIDLLKSLDVRIGRLRLAGNRLRERSLTAITEYVWNSADSLLELDIADNEIVADGSTESDVVSAFLRCLYNHSSYPKILDGGHSGAQVLPLVVRLSGNFIRHTTSLLREIKAKGKPEHVNIVKSPDPFPQVGCHYLCVFLPDFAKQRSSGSTSGRPALPAPIEATGGQAAGAGAMAAPAPAPERRGHAKKEKKEKEKEKKRKRSHEGERPRRRARQEAAEAPPSGAAAEDGGPSAGPPAALHSEAAQRALQQEVGTRLSSIEGFPSDPATKDMLSEFVVCMVVARKGTREIQDELESFLDRASSNAFVLWLSTHMKTAYGASSPGEEGCQ